MGGRVARSARGAIVKERKFAAFLPSVVTFRRDQELTDEGRDRFDRNRYGKLSGDRPGGFFETSVNALADRPDMNGPGGRCKGLECFFDDRVVERAH